jgi:hypothetical protein
MGVTSAVLSMATGLASNYVPCICLQTAVMHMTFREGVAMETPR